MDFEYTVGDCVYLELAYTSPYSIGKIKEFLKSDGVTLVDVLLYNRPNLNELSNIWKHFSVFNQLSLKEKHNLKQRQLVCSKRSKIVPVTFIKGKCSITFLNEAEDLLYFIKKEDTFFYFANSYQRFGKRSEVRVGNNYQAIIPPFVGCSEQNYDDKKETLLWRTDHNLSAEKINYFLQITRFVETLPRALNCCSMTNVNLVTSAIAASRDAVLLHGMNVLHQHNYDLHAARRYLFYNCDKVNAPDNLDNWSSSESKLFELGFKEYKKNFYKIRQTFLPWKSHNEIVEYYYVWKTTDNFIKTHGSKSKTSISCIKMSKNNYLPTIPNYQNYTSISCKKCRKVLYKYGFTLSNTLNKDHLCHGCWSNWKKYGATMYER